MLFTSTSFRVQCVGLAGIMFCFLPLIRTSLLKYIAFCFAFTFPLYGSSAYSTHSFLFELYVTALAITLLITVHKEGMFSGSIRLLHSILFLFLALASASLLLLPVWNMGWQFVLWDWSVFWNAVFFATPERSLYSVAAINRLVLYALFAVLLASFRDGRGLCKMFFIGLLAAAFWASLIGVFEYYKLVNLTWFRAIEGKGLRLQSVFANPGWFAEFVSVTIPYVLLGFIATTIRPVKKILLFGVLLVCEVAIILTYSRTGWVIYPLVLLVCWFCFYLTIRIDKGRFTWQQVAKIFLKVAISVPLTLLISYFAVFHVFNDLDSPDVEKYYSLERQVSELFKPANREVIWAESSGIIKKKPWYGLGYESFKQHNAILEKVKKPWDTPHSFYLQQLVSVGVIGLFLWCTLIFVSLVLLVADLVRNKTYFNIAVILSIVAFHLYAFAQAMAYIPMIWFLIFLNIAYAMTIAENVMPVVLAKRKTLFLSWLTLLVVFGFGVYFFDTESKSLAVQENLQIYSLDQDRDRYLGFYPAERWEQGVYRWTGSSAIIKPPMGSLFELTYVCSAPDLASKSLTVTVSVNQRVIDEIRFTHPQFITRQYSLPEASLGGIELYFNVSRTWNLKKQGVADDSRNLGVAISELTVL